MDTLRSPIDGMKILLEGPPGAGKTSSIRSWVKEGVSVMGLFTEPSYDVVADISCADGFHFAYVPPILEGWAEMLDTAHKVNLLTKKTLANMDWPQRDRYDSVFKVIEKCNNYVCDRCGVAYGDVAKWGTDRCFYVDSLTGLNPMFLQMVVGGNPMKDVGDWGVAIEQEEKFIRILTYGAHCHVVVVAHLDRETDLVLGTVKIYPAALGNKLPTRLGTMFTDVILAQHVAGKFTWEATSASADLKARNFPIQSGLRPEIGPALKAWKSRGGIIE